VVVVPTEAATTPPVGEETVNVTVWCASGLPPEVSVAEMELGDPEVIARGASTASDVGAVVTSNVALADAGESAVSPGKLAVSGYAPGASPVSGIEAVATPEPSV
jgi:hypothetical protein